MWRRSLSHGCGGRADMWQSVRAADRKLGPEFPCIVNLASSWHVLWKCQDKQGMNNNILSEEGRRFLQGGYLASLNLICFNKRPVVRRCCSSGQKTRVVRNGLLGFAQPWHWLLYICYILITMSLAIHKKTLPGMLRRSEHVIFT